jgi:prolyl 4-hydroxylase
MGRMNATMEKKTQLGPRGLELLRDRLRVANDMGETVEWLRAKGYTDEAILDAIETVRPRGDALAQGVINPPLIRRAPANLRKIATDKLLLYTLEDFLSPRECSRLTALIAHHLRPSTVAYASVDAAFRTSTSADLCYLQSPVATAIDEKICRTLGIRAEYSEGIQAQRYDVGQQFKAHCDFFMPGTNAYSRFAGLRGNRTWTFMVYLNDGMEGGATRFHNIDYAVQPRTGTALLWYNLNADGSPNQDTLHSGEPVLRGNKVIITKWFRVFGDGPLFFE